ncbi:MAG: hypothetical protein KME46_31300 [Brasilonema angustatum HA4187-MV1]|jgi:hypothetical protein|nr:hypothetical protein [Brasilonema angustatum HA4187-MV1]
MAQSATLRASVLAPHVSGASRRLRLAERVACPEDIPVRRSHAVGIGCQRLSKDYQVLPETTEAFVKYYQVLPETTEAFAYVAMIRLIIKQLA